MNNIIECKNPKDKTEKVKYIDVVVAATRAVSQLQIYSAYSPSCSSNNNIFGLNNSQVFTRRLEINLSSAWAFSIFAGPSPTNVIVLRRA